jgi:NAD(P)-dependent dehydrogenase (short-subunit alcohol dehydrogenase family)
MHNKAVVVTGGFGYLGAATTRVAIERGARVAVIGRAAQPPAALTAQLGPEAIFLGGVELADAVAAGTALAAARERLQGLDVLINAAGSFRWQKVADGDPDTWESQFASNLQSAVNACRAAIPHLSASRGGRIINVGAYAALKAGAGMGAYAASKSGVHRLTESLAAELKDQRITVNAVLPSTIDTPANRKDMPNADFSKWVSPESLANVILFLASEEAQDITGALLPVTGRT